MIDKRVPEFKCAWIDWRWDWSAMRNLGSGVSELRIDYGPGYRVYYKQHGDDVVVLLAGGDKRTQGRDIQRALALARDL